MQWPGSGEVFGLVVDLFSFSASLAYLTMLEPINELHVAMFAVFIFHNQINTYRDPERSPLFVHLVRIFGPFLWVTLVSYP